MRIYLAAPLFTDAERSLNALLCKTLEPFCEVYLPQRDGILLSEARSHGIKSESLIAQEIYHGDIRAICQSDVLVAVVDGPSVDDGVAFEMGYAAALGITCVAYTSDSRRTADYFNNPMWIASLASSPFTNVDELVGYISSLRADRDRAD
jgi:nucleoside 2-deoxyribosyltransferase